VVSDPEQDLMRDIFWLCSIVDEEQPVHFGEILLGFALHPAPGSLDFRMNLDHLRDRMWLGLDYARRGNALKDTDKTNGRCVLSLIRRLTPDQLRAAIEWHSLAVDDLEENEESGASGRDEAERAREIHGWLLTFL